MDISSLGGIDPLKMKAAFSQDASLEAKLRALQQQGPQTKKEKDLMSAAQDMESFFMYMLLKEMRKTVNESSLFHGGRAEEIFRDMMDEEMSKQISKGSGPGLGIANMLYEQLSRPIVMERLQAQEAAEKGAINPGTAEEKIEE